MSPRPLPRLFSLTARLTTGFTAVAATVVLGLGWFFMDSAEQHFAELDRMTLMDQRHLIEGIVARATTDDHIQQGLAEALAHHHGLGVRLRNAKGHTVFQSPALAPPSLPAPGTNAETATLLHWQQGDRAFHAMQWRLNRPGAPNGPYELLLAADTEHHTRFMTELRHSLAGYAGAAVLLSGLLGWLATFTGLAPLRAMRSRAARVTGQQLEPRMPEAQVPVEMADLARELNQMLDRLQADFQRLSEFASDLAHELRTPISNLLTQTQVALSAPRSPEVYRDTLASNAEEFERLGRMVSDMLFLAQTERGVDLPGREHFDAAPEVEALLDFYDAVAEERHVALQREGEAQVWGDRLMFRRAISNLLSNALRHTPAGGCVRIRLQRSPTGSEVQVIDTGPGIAPHDLPRLFDRFYRGDTARTQPAAEGAGLGLAITRAIVQAHHGHVEVSSVPGHTCFVLHFPD